MIPTSASTATRQKAARDPRDVSPLRGQQHIGADES